MDSEQIIARTRGQNFLISAESTQQQREAIGAFLSNAISLEELLNNLGFQRPSHFNLSRNPLSRIDFATRRKTASQIRGSSSKPFHPEIVDTIRNLNCPKLLALMPTGSRVASDVEIIEALAKEFSDEPGEFGFQVGLFLKGQHLISSHFVSAIELIKENTSVYPEQFSKQASLFTKGYFKGLGRIPKEECYNLLEILDPEDIVEFSQWILANKRSLSASKNTIFETLDKKALTLLARRIIDEDFERQSQGGETYAFWGPYDAKWDKWLSEQVNIYFTKLNSPSYMDQPVSPFTYEEYRMLRDAFSPYSFPKTAASLVHVGFSWSELKLENLTFDALESLSLRPETRLRAQAFLEAVLADDLVLHSEGALKLFDSITEVLDSRLENTQGAFAKNLTISYELRFAAAIASKNKLQLTEGIENVVLLDRRASASYVTGGKPSEAFIQQLIEQAEVEPYIALLTRHFDDSNPINLSEGQIEEIVQHFDEVVTKATARALRNSPGPVGSEHFDKAKTLNELYGELTSSPQQAFPRNSEPNSFPSQIGERGLT